MTRKSLLCALVLLLVSSSIRGDFAWLEDDPTGNIPTLSDVIEVILFLIYQLNTGTIIVFGARNGVTEFFNLLFMKLLLKRLV